jgi:flagellar biosynthesis protein FlhB
MDDTSRTQPASLRRLAWAREQGYSSRSAAMTAAVALGMAAVLLMWEGSRILNLLVEQVRIDLQRRVTGSLSIAQVVDAVRGEVLGLGIAGLWVLGIAWCGSLLMTVFQVGLNWSPAAVAPDFERIDPAQGALRLFSTRMWVGLFLGLVSTVAVFAAGGAGIVFNSGMREPAGDVSIAAAVERVAQSLGQALLQMCAVMVVVGIVDVAWRRASLARSLQMTPEEVREEAGRRKGPQRAA